MTAPGLRLGTRASDPRMRGDWHPDREQPPEHQGGPRRQPGRPRDNLACGVGCACNGEDDCQVVDSRDVPELWFGGAR